MDPTKHKIKPLSTNEMVRLVGTKSRLAKMLGITPGAITQWGEYPYDQHQWRLLMLRPDFYGPDPKPDQKIVTGVIYVPAREVEEDEHRRSAA